MTLLIGAGVPTGTAAENASGLRESALLASIATSMLVAMTSGGLAPAYGQTSFCGTVASGTYTAGFNCAPASGSPATLAISAGTEITAPAGAGARAASQNANATVSITGTEFVSTVATPANGVHAQVTNGSGIAAVSFLGALNTITMGANGDNGVFVQNNTAGSSRIVVGNGTGLNITNNNGTGSERDGVEINSTGSGNVSIIHNGFGSITTANGNGLWLKSANGGSADVTAGAGVSFIINKPGAGGNYAGIHTRVLGGGETDIVSGASIRATGTNAYGIYTQADSGATTIVNSGAITSLG